MGYKRNTTTIKVKDKVDLPKKPQEKWLLDTRKKFIGLNKTLTLKIQQNLNIKQYYTAIETDDNAISPGAISHVGVFMKKVYTTFIL